MTDVTLGARIADFRTSAGLSQAEAAARWHVPTRTLQDWEHRGVANAYAGLIAALLDAVEHG